MRRGAPGSAGWSRCGSRTVASPPPRRSVVLAPLPEISPPESRESPRGLLATLGPPVVRGTKDAELRTGEDGDRPAQAHLVWLGLTGVGRASAPDIPDRRPCLPGVRRAAASARDHRGSTVVRKILPHLGIATECPKPAPARGYGRFIVGRKGHHSRFRWAVPLTHVGQSGVSDSQGPTTAGQETASQAA